MTPERWQQVKEVFHSALRYNDAERDTVSLRRRRMPRLLRLAGAEPLLPFFEIDDTIPAPDPQRTQG